MQFVANKTVLDLVDALTIIMVIRMKAVAPNVYVLFLDVFDFQLTSFVVLYNI